MVVKFCYQLTFKKKALIFDNFKVAILETNGFKESTAQALKLKLIGLNKVQINETLKQ